MPINNLIIPPMQRGRVHLCSVWLSLESLNRLALDPDPLLFLARPWNGAQSTTGTMPGSRPTGALQRVRSFFCSYCTRFLSSLAARPLQQSESMSESIERGFRNLWTGDLQQ